MLKCPFCHFNNEDGALFCDQCKSDLSSVAPVAAVAVPALPVMVEAVPVMAEAVPMVVEAVPVLAEPIDVVPVAVEAVPVEAVPVMTLEAVEAVPMVVEAVPMEAIPVPPVVEVAPVLATPVVTPQPVVTQPATPAPAGGTALPAGAQPRLLVLRGVKRNVEYPIFEGQNFVGRSDDKPVDIDLEEQEPPDRIWCSRQHCVLFFENNELTIEDLNSSNGTFVNRVRLYPGQKKSLAVGDVVQIGNVQMKVVV